MAPSDLSFTDLEPEALAEAALEAAAAAGCENASARVERIRSQVLQLRDGRVETSLDDVSVGGSCRVVHNGSFGFAASIELGPESGVSLAREALDAAEVTRAALRRPVELAPEPSHGRVEWVSDYAIDPTTIPM